MSGIACPITDLIIIVPVAQHFPIKMGLCTSQNARLHPDFVSLLWMHWLYHVGEINGAGSCK